MSLSSEVKVPEILYSLYFRRGACGTLQQKFVSYFVDINDFGSILFRFDRQVSLSERDCLRVLEEVVILAMLPEDVWNGPQLLELPDIISRVPVVDYSLIAKRKRSHDDKVARPNELAIYFQPPSERRLQSAASDTEDFETTKAQGSADDGVLFIAQWVRVLEVLRARGLAAIRVLLRWSRQGERVSEYESEPSELEAMAGRLGCDVRALARLLTRCLLVLYFDIVIGIGKMVGDRLKCVVEEEIPKGTPVRRVAADTPAAPPDSQKPASATDSGSEPADSPAPDSGGPSPPPPASPARRRRFKVAVDWRTLLSSRHHLCPIPKVLSRAQCRPPLIPRSLGTVVCRRSLASLG